MRVRPRLRNRLTCPAHNSRFPANVLAAQSTAAGAAVRAAPAPVSPHSWRRIVGPADGFLKSVARRLEDQVSGFEPDIAGYVRYALASQGKQLRPALLALSAKPIGALTDDLITVATIIEMVHLATLVHDDVMDEARVRRRRPTLSVRCGNAISVLAGDCLFAHALELAASFPTPDICRAVAAATKTVCTGETLQTLLSQRRAILGREEYFRILRMKTGELFALSCRLGGRLTGASDAEEQALHEYGMALGTAYQIYDDCLDLYGLERDAGKSLGTDLAAGKVTLPIIVAYERADPAQRRQLDRLLADWHPERLAPLCAVLDQTDALAESVSAIRALCHSARESVSVPDRPALAEAAEFVEQLTGSLGVPSWKMPS
ncbi:MAG: Heptaprenyl diphosphate synthase component 2 [Verrucomicrobia bacterium ADurb.Bin006]|nr:MAG: Heptaprenyl diphosphate synthase component 2 [Verrucomicrobia bacterium ADurb.Bin006]